MNVLFLLQLGFESVRVGITLITIANIGKLSLSGKSKRALT